MPGRKDSPLPLLRQVDELDPGIQEVLAPRSRPLNIALIRTIDGDDQMVEPALIDGAGKRQQTILTAAEAEIGDHRCDAYSPHQVLPWAVDAVSVMESEGHSRHSNTAGSFATSCSARRTPSESFTSIHSASW